MKPTNNVLLIIGLLLVTLGWFRPSLDMVSNNNKSVISVIIEEPETIETKDACLKVTEILRNGPNAKKDGEVLASLFSDMSKLIELDGADEVIKTTDEILQSNKVAGSLLKMNIKNKYENLSSACQAVVVSVIGEDSLPLDRDLRTKAALAFKNLAWACKESTK